MDHKSLLSFLPSVSRSHLKCAKRSKGSFYSLGPTALTQKRKEKKRKKRMALLPQADDEIKKEKVLFQYSDGYVFLWK